MTDLAPADFNDLVPANEQIPISCKTCSKRIGDLVGPYRLTKIVLQNIMTTGDSGMVDNEGDPVPGPKNLAELQAAYQAEYERYQNIVNQVRINAISLDLDPSVKLEVFKDLNLMSKAYQMSQYREQERSRLYETALSSLRAVKLKENELPVNAANAALIEVPTEEVLLEIVKQNVPKSVNDKIDFRSQHISLQLQRARFPFQDQDPKWRQDIPLLSKFTDQQLIDTFDEIRNIPFLITLPQHQFTQDEFRKLQTVERIEVDDEMVYQKRKYQLHASVAYSIMGIEMLCCRTSAGQPTILPGEVTLNASDVQNLERRNPKILILSRHTPAGDRPSEAAVAEFMKGKLTATQAFAPENTMAALATSLAKTTPILAALADIVSPGQLRLEAAQPTDSGNQTTIGSAPVQSTLPTFAPSTRFGTDKPVPILKPKKTKKVILPSTTVGTITVNDAIPLRMEVKPLTTPAEEPDFAQLSKPKDLRKERGFKLPVIQPEGVGIPLKDRVVGANLLQAV